MIIINKLLEPFQIVLLKRRMCVGCTHPLDKSPRETFREQRAMVQCKCKRKYIHNLETNTYRRATIDEEKEFLNNR